MPELHIEKSVDIDALPSQVWQVLTNPNINREWIRLWWPEFDKLESDWKTGCPVLWKLSDGTIGASGTVSISEPEEILQFSFQANEPDAPSLAINYRLERHDSHTRLFVSVGDFGDTPEHEQCYPAAAEAWNRSLPKIRELAEI